jgi:GAF domain-containing protein
MTPTASDQTLDLIFDPAGTPAPAVRNAVLPLLELTLAQTGSQGAYIYRLYPEDGPSLRLAVWAGLPPSGIGRFRVQLSGARARWHLDPAAPALLDTAAWSDWRFQDFPEFLQHRFEVAAAIPLLDGGALAGIAHICRRQPTPFLAGEAAFLCTLGLPLGSLLAATFTRARLQSEVEQLARRLADRRIVEQAKGLLQSRNSWTEEEAYLHLWRTSRRRRTPMRLIAQEIIHAG